jgi:DNA-binding CsgD family transcriptional regulator
MLNAELSEAEDRVAALVPTGMPNAEIARALYVAEDTVKTHLRRIFRKTGARDRAHLVAWMAYSGRLSRGTPRRRASDAPS